MPPETTPELLPQAADETTGRPGSAGAERGRRPGLEDSDSIPRTQTRPVVRGLVRSELEGHGLGRRGEGGGEGPCGEYLARSRGTRVRTRTHPSPVHDAKGSNTRRVCKRTHQPAPVCCRRRDSWSGTEGGQGFCASCPRCLSSSPHGAEPGAMLGTPAHAGWVMRRALGFGA